MAPSTTSTTTTMAPYSYPLVRKPGSTADVTVSLGGIVRHEMRKGTRPFRKDQAIPLKLDVFNPDTYDFVNDLMTNMTRAEKSILLAEKTFELVLDTYTLRYYRPGIKTVIRQLDPIASQLGKIEKLDVVIDLPYDSGIRDYEEYENSSTYKFLKIVLIALGYFTSLEALNVILVLNEDKPEMDQIKAAWPYIFPFYDLQGFKDWRVKIRHTDGRTNLLCGGSNERIDKLYKEYWPQQ